MFVIPTFGRGKHKSPSQTRKKTGHTLQAESAEPKRNIWCMRVMPTSIHPSHIVIIHAI
jgi:hypothetical protein